MTETWSLLYRYFSHVAKITTVRVFLDIVVKQGHEVHQMDVHNASFHGDLHDEVYMKFLRVSLLQMRLGFVDLENLYMD